MTRTDVIRGISAHCRASHSAALLGMGWLVLGATTETLEELLEVLTSADVQKDLLDHLATYEALIVERYARSSRLD